MFGGGGLACQRATVGLNTNQKRLDPPGEPDGSRRRFRSDRTQIVAVAVTEQRKKCLHFLSPSYAEAFATINGKLTEHQT
jgi:hypothetical protein